MLAILCSESNVRKYIPRMLLWLYSILFILLLYACKIIFHESIRLSEAIVIPLWSFSRVPPVALRKFFGTCLHKRTHAVHVGHVENMECRADIHGHTQNFWTDSVELNPQRNSSLKTCWKTCGKILIQVFFKHQAILKYLLIISQVVAIWWG